MKTTVVLLAALLWQATDFGVVHSDGKPASPEHMQYERGLTVQGDAAAAACAVLDAATFAHAASPSVDDLRVFQYSNNGTLAETPFALSESAAQPVEVASAEVQNLGERAGNLEFDLVMPQRPYSEVDLQLDAKDFVGTAKVSGSGEHAGPNTSLGSFALFDLTAQHLSRSTVLPLQESTFPRLHVELHMSSPAGGKFEGLSPAILLGATVPASREAQTVYTVIATSGATHQEGTRSVVTIGVPAHVPIERVSFVLDPAFPRDFLRTVSIHAGAGNDQQNEQGEISRVTRPGNGSDPGIKAARLSVDAVLGANLRGPATVSVSIENGNDAPLPIKAVQLEMRQRTVCFEFQPGNTYTLRYGDVALRAPVYDFARLYTGEPKPMTAVLGEEKLNANFQARADSRPYTERHPEMLWIGLIAVVAALGATAMHSVKQQGKKG